MFSALGEECSGGIFEMNSIDWASVVRVYKILWLYPSIQDLNEKLRTDYYPLLNLSEGRIELEIALRMCAEDENGQYADPLIQAVSKTVRH